MAKRSISSDDLYRFELLSGATLAPDGRHIIYTLSRIDKKTEKQYSNLWIAPTRGGKARQFTYGDHNDSGPLWSPDGSEILFRSNRGGSGGAQLYLIPLNGGEARQISKLEGNIGSYDWFPDGRRLLISYTLKDKLDKEREADPQKKKLGVVSRHITRNFFKFDGGQFTPEERSHIYSVDVRTGKERRLTPAGPHDEGSATISPDGKWIAFSSDRSDDPELEPFQGDLYVMPSSGSADDDSGLRKLPTDKAGKFALSFSPDGNWLAFLGSAGEGAWYANMHLWIAPVDGSSPARSLTAEADIHCFNITNGDLGGDGLSKPTWSPDGQRIYFQVTVRGDTALMSVAVADGTIRREIEAAGAVYGFSFDKAHSQMAYMLGDFSSPGMLWLRNEGTGRSRQLVQTNRWLNRLQLGQIEEINFKARDEYDLQGWVIYPPDFDPQKKYASVMEIHGGPQTQYGRKFMHEFYFLAAKGYVVYFSNPRGGQGYGEAHCAAIHNQWGTVDYDDIIDWADYMAAQSYIDNDRMGVTGGSYGGYMTNMLIGRTDRFKAAVTQRSVSNLISMWGTSDGNWIFQRSFGEDKPPFENLDKYWEQSPLKYIGGAKTPTLVIHSEKDWRAHQEQGEQVYVALKKLGVDTELILFPDSPHGLSRVGRTDRRIVRLEHILRWFDKYMPADEE